MDNKIPVILANPVIFGSVFFIAFFIGLLTGYSIWAKTTKETQIQINATQAFFGVLLSIYLYLGTPDPIIAVALISSVAGVPIGEKIAEKAGVKK